MHGIVLRFVVVILIVLVELCDSFAKIHQSFLIGNLNVDYFMMTSRHGNDFRVICPFVRGTHWSPVDPIHKGQLMTDFVFFFDVNLIKLLINRPQIGGLRRHEAHVTLF